MKITIRSAVLTVSCAAIMGALIQTKGGLLREARAQEQGCDVSSLQGTYGYYRFGINNDVGAITEVGITTYDGKGNLSFRSTISRAGVIEEASGSGPYTVNPDCTTGSPGDRFRGVIVDGGKEVYIFTALEGRNIFAVGKKQ